MEIYIKGTGIISPQHTFDSDHFTDQDVVDYKEALYLKCIEPVYKEYLDPMMARRMNRIVKMGVCAAKKCMQHAQVSMPDAIITGTGLGCMGDTEKFLDSMISNNEQLLNPTPFIQSTHNTVSAAIALAIKCHGYNSTYVHRGFSFENALQDGMLFLQEHPGKNILVGGLDEITEHSYQITSRLGLWKRHPVDSLSLLQYNDQGALPGEGAAFFMLSDRKEDGTLAKIQACGTHYRPEKGGMQEQILTFLSDAGTELSDLDLVIMGYSGDQTTDCIYTDLRKKLFRDSPVACYKTLCGEYHTSMAFALWLASTVIRQQQIPEVIKTEAFDARSVRTVLIYNQMYGVNHSMMLVTTC